MVDRKNGAWRATVANARLTATNANQPAWEWNPPSATFGENQTPMSTNKAIRKALASQMTIVPSGRSSSAGETVGRGGNTRGSLPGSPDQADPFVARAGSSMSTANAAVPTRSSAA